MKLNKKYILTASILGCLVLGIYVGNNYLLPRNTYNYIGAPSPIFAGGDISTYSNQADAIVIGRVKDVSDAYLTKERGLTLQQDASLEVEEVLKGDPNVKQIAIKDLGLFFTEGYFAEEGVESMKGKYALLKPNERVLLFLGSNNFGQSVVLSGPYGKYLIESEEVVTSAGNFKMTLNDVKNKIRTALDNPTPKIIKSKEIWEEE